jgi:hypothetical protein
MSAQRPYRPSNGTEGDIFLANWCESCASGSNEDDPCRVQMYAFNFNIDDDEYPSEWIYRNGVPTCTVYQHELDADGEELTVRCDKTPDMFQDAV